MQLAFISLHLSLALLSLVFVVLRIFSCSDYVYFRSRVFFPFSYGMLFPFGALAVDIVPFSINDASDALLPALGLIGFVIADKPLLV
jgi:hypothetical protein